MVLLQGRQGSEDGFAPPSVAVPPSDGTARARGAALGAASPAPASFLNGDGGINPVGDQPPLADTSIFDTTAGGASLGEPAASLFVSELSTRAFWTLLALAPCTRKVGYDRHGLTPSSYGLRCVMRRWQTGRAHHDYRLKACGGY